MSKPQTIKWLFIATTLFVFSCSKKEEDIPCKPTLITMKINGVLRTFDATGRGIDLNGDGYLLSLNADRIQQSPYEEQGVAIYLPYKKTGENLITHFIYHEYINGIVFDGDFINGELTSHVITNKRTCVEIEFSGKLSDGNQEIVITEGKFINEYESPFDF